MLPLTTCQALSCRKTVASAWGGAVCKKKGVHESSERSITVFPMSHFWKLQEDRISVKITNIF